MPITRATPATVRAGIAMIAGRVDHGLEAGGRVVPVGRAVMAIAVGRVVRVQADLVEIVVVGRAPVGLAAIGRTVEVAGVAMTGATMIGAMTTVRPARRRSRRRRR